MADPEPSSTAMPSASQRIGIISGSIVAAGAALYATGFLISATFFARFGINSAGWDLVRGDYIMTGVLFWAFPLLALFTVLLLRRTSKLKKEGTLGYDDMTEQRIAALALFLLDFYIVSLFARPTSLAADSAFRNWILGYIVFILCALVVSITLIALRNHFHGKQLKREDGPHFWVEVRHHTDTVIIIGFVLFFIAFLYHLRIQLGEMLAKHLLPLSCFFLFVAFSVLLVLRACVRDTEDPDPSGRLIRWLSMGGILGLVLYLTVASYTHSIHLYISASHGGADFTDGRQLELPPSDN